MVVSRRIAWAILLGTIFTAGILRQFHARIPSSPFLPQPVGSLLFFLVLILFLVYARGWGGRQQIPYAGAGLKRFNFLALVPLLIALTLEKWVSITLYGPLFYRINRPVADPVRFNALYVIESAAGLLVISVLLLPLFRRLWPLLRKYLSPRRIPVAALGIVLTLAVIYGGVGLLFRVAGGENVRLGWTGFGRWGSLTLGGQALIAFAEEVYYRGLLQSELAFLLPALGLPQDRARRIGAVGLVSVSFALEHLEWSETHRRDLRMLSFYFASSLFLGALMMLLDNLWFSAGCHFVLNLFVLGGGPSTPGAGLLFRDASGRPLLDPALYIFLFFIFAFVFTWAVIGVESRRAPRRPVVRT